LIGGVQDGNETLNNGVIILPNPCFQFLQPNMRWVDFVPKSNMQPNTERVGSVHKKWVGSNPTLPTPKQTHG
jgi:hypothetical protein